MNGFVSPQLGPQIGKLLLGVVVLGILPAEDHHGRITGDDPENAEYYHSDYEQRRDEQEGPFGYIRPHLAPRFSNGEFEVNLSTASTATVQLQQGDKRSLELSQFGITRR